MKPVRLLIDKLYEVKLFDRCKPVIDALREWRTNKCKEASLPVYIVLRNDAINNISKTLPKDLETLADVKGIGPTTLERYGEDILEVLKNVEAPEPVQSTA